MIRKFTEYSKINETESLEEYTIADIESIKNGRMTGNSMYNFWLVTEATPESELLDVITLVDSFSLFRIARGSEVSNDTYIEIFPYDRGEEALALAKERIKKEK